MLCSMLCRGVLQTPSQKEPLQTPRQKEPLQTPRQKEPLQRPHKKNWTPPAEVKPLKANALTSYLLPKKIPQKALQSKKTLYLCSIFLYKPNIT